jgi:IclR family transcriptional regulator, acetate operon repressor
VVFRILHTLEGRGFVTRRSDKRYLPAWGITRDNTALPLDLLGLLAKAGPAGASAGDLAADAGADPAGVAQILAQLESRGLATANEAGGWLPGLGILELARPLLRGSLRTAVRPLMERLRDESGETAMLFVSSGSRQVVIDVAPSREPLRYELEIGRSFDLHRGAAGKAAMAAMNGEAVRALLDRAGLAPEARRSLVAELETVRTLGYATSTGERIAGASAVAAVVRDEAGRPRGVLGLMMPAFRNPPDRLRHLGKVLVNQLAQLHLPEDIAAAKSGARGEGN